MHINLGDVLRIEDFIEHAQFHKKNYGDNLLTFISKHYGQEKKEHHQNESHDHDKLPFSGCSIIHAPVALLGQLFTPEFQRFDNFEKQDNFSFQLRHSSPAIFDIFQPPKSA
ncbi:hypothetical protein GCM10011312_18650 [Planktosalinus lacus]|uniref:Uncharacterized protein n=2 Tax=Planktosalinus lacus TaxID=1526573 RepID=A0A8J2YBD9_9FLAO|nr:hypothetical protein GCM10011312_18650 [Planktosalinus lacus]